MVLVLGLSCCVHDLRTRPLGSGPWAVWGDRVAAFEAALNFETRILCRLSKLCDMAINFRENFPLRA